MLQIEQEIKSLKEELVNMGDLVKAQLHKSKLALKNFDKNLAREIVIKERRVNGYELKIDRDCENVLALRTPVAVDLRFVLAVLKINSNLERIGDIAEGIAKYIIHTETKFATTLLERSKVLQMLEVAISILEDGMASFEHENTILARSIFLRDEFLDEVNSQAIDFTKGYLVEKPSEIDEVLYILSIIRKLERVGDHVKNIAEEIIFYIEAKVLKHNKDLQP
ncbi:phosphate signaling complex protein PhoU [Arachidicoccus ginsenosidivorans]|jgi:phosphate transport system protein|uniref:Phosphate-specific transport system accessory protein PhoU n=1 Tax=Arachidicoccus ginsenosidivorans TaxID=496057 RepID=A0A5B8VTF5_9BACT|nr:phosphate signaling complex protein PhoU [Arachidicoccus ginsenosidivorans]QEC73865.1 phosphate signaling complex protein PhoU [Arachidicoccus ginsenosidivorans]